MSNFVHLHTHSMYSPLDGVASPKEYFKVCSERKYPALAITEHGNMASIPECYWASKETGVKFIIGCEVYYNDYEQERRNMEINGLSSKEFTEEDKGRYLKHRHLTILCKNKTGYFNLLKIRRKSYEEGFYRKARASLDIIKNHHEGIIILSGCMNGPISFEYMQYIIKKELGIYSDSVCNEHLKKAENLANHYKEMLGDDFYIELQMPGIKNDHILFGMLALLAEKLRIKCVLTNDAHYITEDDYNVQRVMMAVDQNTTIDSPDLFISKSTSGYFKTREQLRKTYDDGYASCASSKLFESSCDNTLEIAEKCEQIDLDTSLKLPHIIDADNKLKKLVKEGLTKKRLINNKEYVSRAIFELNRIIEKEFSPYFLICRDLVNESTKNLGMPVGPRGSAGGSLLCYLIDIHDIDPIQWGLSFDRFLSSARGGKLLKVDMEDDEETQ